MTRALVLAGVTACASVSILAGQTPFRSGTDVVEVYATVKLKDGTIARDLTRDDFELLDDGKPRDISVFSRSDQPLSVALVLDRSGSIGKNFDAVRLAAQLFVGRLLDADRASIRTLTWDCMGFTNDRLALVQALRRFIPPDESSPVWSATDSAVSSLAMEAGRRVILLLSDGDDAPGGAKPSTAPSPPWAAPCQRALAGERSSFGDVLTRIERDGVMVYTVGVPPVGVPDGLGLDKLVTLAQRSGAEYRRLGSFEQLQAAFQSIADELHLQYLLGFVPASFDGQRHEIQVRVKRPGVTVRARKAYVAIRGGA
jgi:Ca-activated chloride channel family protein